jgi:hypothetical protein
MKRCRKRQQYQYFILFIYDVFIDKSGSGRLPESERNAFCLNSGNGLTDESRPPVSHDRVLRSDFQRKAAKQHPRPVRQASAVCKPLMQLQDLLKGSGLDIGDLD